MMTFGQDDARVSDLLIRWEELREQGEAIAIEELCDAEQLRRRIAALEEMDPLCSAAGRSLAQRDNGDLVHATASPPQRLAARCTSTYSDLRFHAAGGLGEVFMAQGDDLHRDVALKFLKSRSARDPESQRRFLQEAEVTGRLEHPGIVPVYSLGRDEEDRPCYAMRFIRGRTLDEAIHEFHAARVKARPADRNHALRELINRLVSVCNTIAYAHGRGVLHRDIKPKNIMLGNYDETLVVDWGLARSFDRSGVERSGGEEPLRPGPGGGGSGKATVGVIGTPAFMSPEQAAGDHARVGPASDIYSLGATLYVILTGRTASAGRSFGELIERVRRGDLVPPRQVGHDVPRALDAICLKAMALRPEDRYATALELADDLKRWLADEPVTACREPLLTRMARWRRRHRPALAGIWAVLGTALVATSVASMLMLPEFHKKQVEEHDARAEKYIRLAAAVVDQMLTEVGAVELADAPQMEQVRRRMLDKALKFYDNFLDERGNDRSIRQQTSRVYLRLGDIEEMLGDYVGAEAAYKCAIAFCTTLVADQPAHADARRDLASARHKLGVLLKKSNRFADSEKALREAQRLRRQLVAAFPDNIDDQRDEMDSVYQLGTVLACLGRVKEVKAAYAAADDTERKLAAAHPDQRDYPRKLGRHLNSRALLLRCTGTADQWPAEDAFREALELQKPLAEKSPTVTGLQWDRARATSNLAGTLVETQGSAKAVPVYRKAVAQFQRLADDFPSVPDYQNGLAIVSFNLGSTLLRQAGSVEKAGDHDAAVRLRTEASEPLLAATEIYRSLIQPERFPHRPDYRQKLALAERKRGMLLASIGQTAEAETVFRAAVKELKELESQYPKVPEYQSDLGVALQNLAVNQFARQQPDEARQLCHESIARQRNALASNPKDPFSQRCLMDTYEVLEAALGQLGDHAGAAQAADALAELLPAEPTATFHSARMLGLSASLAATAGDLPEARRKEIAVGRAALTLKRLQNAVKEGAKILPRDLDAPAFDAIRVYFPDAFDALKKSLEARMTNPKVG